MERLRLPVNGMRRSGPGAACGRPRGAVRVPRSDTASDAITDADVSKYFPRPSKASVRSICRKISELTQCRAIRTAGTGTGGGEAEPSAARLGELLPTGAGKSGVPRRGRACDQAAAPVAVPEAQGEVGEIRALPRQEAVIGRPRPRAPCDADGQPSVGEGMISSESRMLEIGTSGSMSGERNRG